MAKKTLTLIIAMTILTSPLQAFGAPAGFQVYNEYEYEDSIYYRKTHEILRA